MEKERRARYATASELSLELRALLRQIDSGAVFDTDSDFQTASGRRTRSRRGIDSLAILPLANASGESDMDYLSDGITESIINNLSQLPKLRVMARSTVFRYKGRDVDPIPVGRELGVRAILMGRVLQRGDRLIIKVELVDTSDGAQVWGEQYNRSTADIFAIEEEISSVISEKLRLKLSGAQKKRLAKRHTKNTEAYNLYLQGRFYWNKRTEEFLKKGIEYFEQAIASDADYALAYTGLADSYNILVSYSALKPDEAFPKAKAAARRALELDPNLAEAHTSLAFVEFGYDWNWAEAEQRL
jgi:serine/threonine-protein kinase